MEKRGEGSRKRRKEEEEVEKKKRRRKRRRKKNRKKGGERMQGKRRKEETKESNLDTSQPNCWETKKKIFCFGRLRRVKILRPSWSTW